MTDRLQDKLWLILLGLFLVLAVGFMAMQVQADTPEPCDPPCYDILIKTDPPTNECVCPSMHIEPVIRYPNFGEITFDGTWKYGPPRENIRLDPHSNSKGWEIRTDDEWICVRRRGDD